MDLFLLDGLLRRTEVIDDYKSFIWAERYRDVGDIEINIHSTRGTRAMFQPGALFGSNKSYRVMQLETVEATTDEDGVSMLKATGFSIENILKQRFDTPSSVAAGTAVADPEYTGTPGAIMRARFDATCRNNTATPGDNVPFLQSGTLLPAGSIAEPSYSITIQPGKGSTYEVLRKIAEVYDLGFRLIKDGDTGNLYFSVYTGDDRTTQQSANSPVIFARELDTLSGTSELSSIANFKNVAYVVAPNGSRIVYLLGASATTSGFDRRVLYVDASDIDLAAGTALQNALEQRGQEELAKNGVVIAFDGEISQRGPYIYGEDYSLGDLVETRNADGLTTNMRVTEQIFVADENGERSYPTLESRLLITPGSWLAWDSSGMWLDAVGEWVDA